MTSSGRIALYLRVIAGEVAEAKGEVAAGMADRETAATLDAVSVKLRDLADTFEAEAGHVRACLTTVSYSRPRNSGAR